MAKSSRLSTQPGAEMLKQNPMRRKIPKDFDPATPAVSLSSRRIVLLGKSGVGMSAAGNTILGKKVFRSEMSTSSVTSKSSVKHATVSGRSVSVVDTPGLFDTQMNTDALMKKIMRCVYLSSPGPHAFLIVISVNNRFTEQEQQIPQKIKMMFGQEVLKYSIILFTHRDLLRGKSVEKLLEENCILRDLVDQCGGRFDIFNNRNVNNRVNDLLKKIDTMIEDNGGGHYSNQMYEDAKRFRQEEEEKRQREEEEERQREEEEQRQREEEEEEEQRQREEEEEEEQRQRDEDEEEEQRQRDEDEEEEQRQREEEEEEEQRKRQRDEYEEEEQRQRYEEEQRQREEEYGIQQNNECVCS